MTVGELIDAHSDYDRELELKAESNFGDRFEIEHVWQLDNSKKAADYAEQTLDKWQKEKAFGLRRLIAEAYEQGVREAMAMQWHPLTPDHSPNLNEDVLIMGETGDVMVAQIVETNLHGTSLKQLTWLPQIKCKVVAWMSIPKYEIGILRQPQNTDSKK